MYCPKCGTLNPEEGKLCLSCNWVLRKEGDSTLAESPEAKISGLATTSVVLSVIGFLTFGLTFVPAMIIGLIAIFKIDRSSGQLRGKGRAIFSLFAPVFIFPILVMMMAILMPALGKVRCMSQRLICGTNLKAIYNSVSVYADSHEGMVPQGDNWCDVLVENADVDAGLFCCPRSAENASNYALNVNAAGKELDSLPPQMVLLYECAPSWNACGGPELMTIYNHDGNGCNIVYCDGHVAFEKANDLNYLIWNEQQAKEAGYAKD
jgi:prepilin-type processing-associated H-X9-DG protein